MQIILYIFVKYILASEHHFKSYIFMHHIDDGSQFKDIYLREDSFAQSLKHKRAGMNTNHSYNINYI